MILAYEVVDAGPCSGSVFLMDSTNCRVAVAAKQLRLRDCRDCSLHIFAPTSESAVVETSKDLTFGCWQVAYPELGAQFAAAGWGASMTNHWAKVPLWLVFQPPTIH